MKQCMKNSPKTMLFSAALLACVAQVQAQSHKNDSTLNRTVVVENQYNPQIMDADKINLLPAVEEPKVSKTLIEYAETKQPFHHFVYRTMPAYGPMPIQPDAPKTFINLGYGETKNGNILGEINHLFDFGGTTDKLNLNARFDGYNYKVSDYGTPGQRLRYYQSQVQADYRHLFTTVELGASASVGTQTFNYLGYDTDKQNNLIGGANIYIRSTKEDLQWQYALDAGIRGFSRDYLYGEKNSNSETNFRLNGNVAYRWQESSRIGLKLRIDQASYSLKELKGSGVVALTPYYNFQTSGVNLHVGAAVELSTGYKSSLTITPDVMAEFPFGGQYVLYAQAKGGTLVNDFFRFNSITPYWGGFYEPNQMRNTHVQLDGTAGFRATPTDNLWINVFGGFELRKNELGFMPDITVGGTPIYSSFVQDKAHNAKAGAALTYKYKDIIDLSAEGTYRSWSSDNDYVLYDKPSLDFKLDMGVHPIPALTLHLGYHHRSYSKGPMPDVQDLYAGADYRILKFFSLWLKADNLMNKQYQYYYSYPAQKINFMIGASFRF